MLALIQHNCLFNRVWIYFRCILTSFKSLLVGQQMFTSWYQVNLIAVILDCSTSEIDAEDLYKLGPSFIYLY